MIDSKNSEIPVVQPISIIDECNSDKHIYTVNIPQIIAQKWIQPLCSSQEACLIRNFTTFLTLFFILKNRTKYLRCIWLLVMWMHRSNFLILCYGGGSSSRTSGIGDIGTIPLATSTSTGTTTTTKLSRRSGTGTVYGTAASVNSISICSSKSVRVSRT